MNYVCFRFGKHVQWPEGYVLDDVFHSQPRGLYLDTYNAWVEHQRHYVADDNRAKQRLLFEKEHPDLLDETEQDLPEFISPDVLVESGHELNLEVNMATRDPLGWLLNSLFIKL